MRPQYNGDDPRNVMPVGGAPGDYRVVFTFARPGYTPVREREFSMDPAIPGDSHLAIAPPAVTSRGKDHDPTAIRIRATTDAGHFLFDGYPNAAGFLGRIEGTFPAANIKDAEVKAHQAIASSLSNWSAHFDVPFWIWRTLVSELASGSVQITITNPFLNVPFAFRAEGTMTKEYRAFASLYREAVGTNSPAYAFLCFFKIAEGVGKRRQRLANEAIQRGETPNRPSERIPKTRDEYEPWLNALFPARAPKWDDLTLDAVFIAEVLGRKIQDLLKHELVDVRNAIGHALSDESGEPALIVDEALPLDRVHQWLPLMRCIARRMLKNEFPAEFLTYLNEDGKLTE
jgi:hypothetical protein